MRNNTVKLIVLALLAIIFILLYGFYDIKGGFDYAFPKRMIRVAAMVVTGCAIALFNCRVPDDYTKPNFNSFCHGA